MARRALIAVSLNHNRGGHLLVNSLPACMRSACHSCTHTWRVLRACCPPPASHGLILLTHFCLFVSALAGTWVWWTSKQTRAPWSCGGTPRQGLFSCTACVVVVWLGAAAMGRQAVARCGPCLMCMPAKFPNRYAAACAPLAHTRPSPIAPSPGPAPPPAPQDHPFAQLSGSDNIIAFTTQRYSAKVRLVCWRAQMSAYALAQLGCIAEPPGLAACSSRPAYLPVQVSSGASPANPGPSALA